MGWLEDLIGDSGYGNSGFENWLAPTDLFSPGQFGQDLANTSDMTNSELFPIISQASHGIHDAVYPYVSKANQLNAIPELSKVLGSSLGVSPENNPGYQVTKPIADLPAQMLSDPSQAALLPLFSNPVTGIPAAGYFMHEMAQGAGESLGNAWSDVDQGNSPWSNIGSGIGQLGMAGLAGMGGFHEGMGLAEGSHLSTKETPGQYNSNIQVVPPENINVIGRGQKVYDVPLNQIPDGVPGMDSSTGERFILANGQKYILPDMSSQEGSIINPFANAPKENKLFDAAGNEIPKNTIDESTGLPLPGNVTMANTGGGKAVNSRSFVDLDLIDKQKELLGDNPNPFDPVAEAKTKGILGNQEGMVRNPFDPEPNPNDVIVPKKLTKQEEDLRQMMMGGFGNGEKLPEPKTLIPEGANVIDVKPETTRLYRGGPPNNEVGTKGIWYSSDPEVAKSYQPMSGGQLKYIDVTPEQLKAFDRGNYPGGEPIYKVTPEEAAKAQLHKPDSEVSLADHVSQMKEKYGNRSWRNKMTDSEANTFDDLMNGIQKNKIPETIFPEELKSQSKPETKEELKAIDLKNQEDLYDEIKNKPITQEEIVSAQKKKGLFGNQEGSVNNPFNPPPKTTGTKAQGNPNAPDILEPISKTERALLPAEEIIKRANPNISVKEKAFRNEKETEGSTSYTIAEIARREANKISKTAEERIAKYTAGKQIVLSPAEKTIADTLTSELHSRGVNSNDMISAYNRAKKYDFSVIKQKLFDVTEASAEKTHLKDLKYDIANKSDANSRQTKKYVDKYIQNITGRTPEEGPVGKAAATARKIAAYGDLKQTAFSQFTQTVPSAATMGINNSIRAIGRMLKDGYEPHELKAMSDGSLWASIAHETSKSMAENGWMHGIATADKVMRVHANVAARILAEQALKGGKLGLTRAKELGLNIRDPRFTDKFAKALTDKTQLRTDIAHVPAWTKETFGKLPFQYMSFGYRHAAYVSDLVKHPWRNGGSGIKQLARFAAIGVGVGEGIADSKNLLNSIFPGKDESDDLIKRLIEGFQGDPDFDSKELVDKLRAATQNKRIPFSSPGWRALQNLSNVGGAGTYQTILERTFDEHKSLDEKVVANVGGPVASHLLEGAKAVGKDFNRYSKYDIKNPVNFERYLLQRQPFFLPGFSTYKTSNFVFPPDEYKNPRVKGKHKNKF